MIEVVTQYKCPVTGKLWPTEKQAKDCAARAKAREKKKLAEREEEKKLAEQKEFRRNFVRLNAKSPAHAFELLLSKSEEFWGVQFELPGISWCINKDMGRLCSDTVTIKAAVTDTVRFEEYFRKRDKYWSTNISEFLRFIGFDTGSGNPGSFGVYPFRMGMYIPLENFPAIRENLKLVESDRSKIRHRLKDRDHVTRMAKVTASKQPELEEMQTIIDRLNGALADLQAKRDEYIDNFANKYVTEFWDKINPEPSVNSELLGMFSNVR